MGLVRSAFAAPVVAGLSARGGDLPNPEVLCEARRNGIAPPNTELTRMEMHLVSGADEIVNAGRHTFAFKAGERLYTENSHKFTTESFAELAARAGWSVTPEWIGSAPAICHH